MAVDVDSAVIDEQTEAPQNTESDGATQVRAPSRVRSALVAGAVMVVALGGLTGWFGWQAYHAVQSQSLRNLFVQTARQGALNLTTISYTHADADVRRIVDSATSPFRDEFEQRSQPFIDAVRQARSTTEGEVVAAGLESVDGDRADALVAVTVKTSTADVAQSQTKEWRMRITVQKVGDEAKVSGVEFVA
ncbi:MAG: hypothetical protein WCE30_16295 [Mycobacterium sp.]